MTRVLAQYLSVATAALGLIEFGLSFLLLLAALIASGAASWDGDPLGQGNLAVCLALAAAGSAAIVGLYRPEFYRDQRNMLIKIGVAGTSAVALALLIIAALQSGLSRQTVLWVVGMLLVWVGCMVLIRLAFAALARRNLLTRRVLVLGSGLRAERVVGLLRTRYGMRYEPLAALPESRVPMPAELRRQRIWGVVLAVEDVDDGLAQALLDSKLRGVRVLPDTGFFEQHLGRIDLDTIDTGVAARRRRICRRAGSAAVLKRCCDIVVSLILLFPDPAVDGTDRPADQAR